MSARRPSQRPNQPRPAQGRPGGNGRPVGGEGRAKGPRRPRPERSAKQRGRTSGSRRNETRQPRKRFATRRSVVVDGASGPRQISLRLVSILLFAIIAVIVVTPTFSNYLEKQRELRDLRAKLEYVQQHNKELKRELDLWSDDDYVRSQARERLGYVMPGQTLYVVTDSSKGTAQEQLERRVKSVNRDRRAATPWYTTMWDSVNVAGQSGGADDADDTPIIEDATNGR